MLISDVFMESPFANSTIIGLDLRHQKQYNVTQCNKKGPFSFVCKQSRKVLKCILLASKPLIIMQIPHNFNKQLIFN